MNGHTYSNEQQCTAFDELTKWCNLSAILNTSTIMSKHITVCLNIELFSEIINISNVKIIFRNRPISKQNVDQHRLRSNCWQCNYIIF